MKKIPAYVYETYDKFIKDLEPCEDAVSREAVINVIHANSVWENEYNLTSSRIKEAVEALPPVTPKPTECEDAVDRDTIIQEMEKRHKEGDAITLGYIKNLPPVSPKPKTGKWIKTPKAVMSEGYLWYCDKCGHQVYQDTSRPYPSERYCPNCGAKMEG